MGKFHALVNYLKKHHIILATAESCTAGEIMSLLTQEGDCGDCLFTGYVAYSSTAKKKQLGVKSSTIKKHTLTSEQVAYEMAKGVFQHKEINAAIATTGITGKEPMDGIQPGTVCFAWSFKQGKNIIVYCETKLFNPHIKNLPRKAAAYALSKFEQYHQLFLND